MPKQLQKKTKKIKVTPFILQCLRDIVYKIYAAKEHVTIKSIHRRFSEEVQLGCHKLNSPQHKWSIMGYCKSKLAKKKDYHLDKYAEWNGHGVYKVAALPLPVQCH